MLGDFLNIVLAVIAVVVYFAPSWISISRRALHPLPIFLLNLVLGWSVIGWVVALVWALLTSTAQRKEPERPVRPEIAG
jgi:T4 superinfection immunity protein